MRAPLATPVPVTLITGFLGAGKTTLLNKLIARGDLKDAALVINEFGDVGIDQLLVETADEGIVEMSDGCLCCTIRGDLVDTLSRLLGRKGGAPKRVVIETTGLADPAPILHAIMGHPVLSEDLRLDGVITLVDAVNGNHTLDTHEEAVKQAAVADRLVITKTDLARELDRDIDQLRGRLGALNPTGRQIIASTTSPSALDIFECGLYNPSTKTADVQRWLNAASEEDAHNHGHTHDHGHHHHHEPNRHDARIRSFSLTTDKAIDAATLTNFLDLLRSAHGPNLLRLKGIVKIAEDPDRPVVLHGVQQIFHPPASLPDWPDHDHTTRLVIITRDLPEEFVTRLFNAFVGEVASDTPDRTALDANPLTVPGHSGNFR